MGNTCNTEDQKADLGRDLLARQIEEQGKYVALNTLAIRQSGSLRICQIDIATKAWFIT